MIGKFLDLIRNNKKKIFLGSIFYILFLVVLFPFQDLGVFVSTQVAKLTQNQVHLKFDNLNLSVTPAPGLIFSNVTVQTVQLPALSAETLKIYPNILGLLALKPGFSAQASNLFDGDISLSLRGASAGKSGQMKQVIAIDADEIQLKKLSDFLKLPMNLEGYVSLEADADVDPGFVDQPNAKLNLNGNRVNITSAVVPTQFGPLNLPDTKLQEIIAKAVLNNGDLEIERVQLGNPQDELYAQMRGSMKIQMKPQGPQVSVVPGAFDFVVQIKTKPSFQAKAGVFLSFLDSYKKSEGDYIFRAQGTNFYAPPRLTALSSF